MILQRFQATSGSLQRSDIDVSTVINLYESLSMFNEAKRCDEVFTSLEHEAKVLSGCSSFKQTRKRKYAVLFPDDARGDDVLRDKSPSEKFRTQSYFVILDTLVSEI